MENRSHTEGTYWAGTGVRPLSEAERDEALKRLMRMPPRMVFRDRGRAIRGGIVQQHDLDAVHRLRQDRIEAGRQVTLHVVQRNQQAQPGRVLGRRHGQRGERNERAVYAPLMPPRRRQA